MTANELQRIVTRLANQSWCRYWLNYGDRHKDVEMAIQCLDGDQAIKIRDLEMMGFKRCSMGVYTIPRTNDDGTPFVSSLF
jgi:hypothetical protein